MPDPSEHTNPASAITDPAGAASVAKALRDRHGDRNVATYSRTTDVAVVVRYEPDALDIALPGGTY